MSHLRYKKLFFLMSSLLLSLNLIACNQTTKQEPKSEIYPGDFGGDGGHVHQNK
ncbi:hypothetical protein ACNVED_16945 (plasmid) [Legionella sp. D16C41]|uniref:hypothetical protein n=1 Tax=Legionella sp. D16C41 TaxID=3402688 RepID=UPI003AF99027